jgi:hypothetical protein
MINRYEAERHSDTQNINAIPESKYTVLKGIKGVEIKFRALFRYSSVAEWRPRRPTPLFCDLRSQI